ncbi:MAG: hypothetical protein CVU71_03610 [Deltaproteobacteria bacterium HGW-Deltaproteobacteria-6]|jgi:hypothetical protein|nr:MAG: hypothetical protein CVU71_03610 [Deltaproteobacteria bacterium HGW-Deltaproteobacteria-6]
MSWTEALSITTGNASKKSEIDAAFNNTLYLRDYQALGLARNLKPVVNAAVNKLDIFTKSGGAAPAAAHIIGVAIPDGNGHTFRTRAAAYLSGTSQIIMADAANYWSKGTLDAEIKTAWLYAIWDGTGIVWALAGYSGFTIVPTTTTATDDDYFLLEDGSTYTRSASHYCVAVAKIRYQYDTADTPDHTIQATALDAPRVIWNPKSDYGYSKNLAATVTSGSDIAVYSAISVVVKQPGKYKMSGAAMGMAAGAPWSLWAYIKTGSATYGSAVRKALGLFNAPSGFGSFNNFAIAGEKQVYLNSGDTIHLGLSLSGDSGNRVIQGDDAYVGATSLSFARVD